MKKLPTRFEDAKQSPGFQLWRVGNLWQRHIKQALREFDLTHVQFVLLAVASHLGESGGPVNQGQLAEAASTDKMMTSQVLRTLEEKGLIARTPDPEDARAMLVALTDAGHALVGDAIRCVEDADEKFFGPLGSDQATLAQFLHQLTESGDEVGG